MQNQNKNITNFQEYTSFSHTLSMFILGIFLIRILYSYNIGKIYLPYITLSIVLGILFISINKNKSGKEHLFDKNINTLIYINAINLIVYFYYNDPHIELLYLLPIIIYSTEYGQGFGLKVAGYSCVSLLILSYSKNQPFSFDIDFVLIIMFLWLAWLIGGVVNTERKVQNNLVDVSEQLRKSNKELKESQELFKLNFEESNIGMIFENTEGEIIKINKAMSDILGYTKEELTNINISEITHKEDLGISKKYKDNLLKNNIKTVNFQKRYYHKNGQTIWVTINSTIAWNGNGSAFHIFSHIENITEKKKAEKKILKQAKEIEHQKLRTKFFANLSHELRTPLNLIFSALQIIRLKQKRQDQHLEITNYLDIISLNSNRLLRLVNNIIDLTKIEAESFNVKLQNYDIINVVKKITNSTKEYINSKNRKIYFNTSIGSKIIACDPFSMERVLLNLISNAVKFTGENDLIFVNIFEEEKYIIIEVADTGIGIKPENLDMIFEYFRQIDESFSRKTEGSGIGLSLVKSLVELHQGYIEVESEYGEGSSFKIYLPIRQLPNPTEPVKYDKELIDKVSLEFSDIYDHVG